MRGYVSERTINEVRPDPVLQEELLSTLCLKLRRAGASPSELDGSTIVFSCSRFGSRGNFSSVGRGAGVIVDGVDRVRAISHGLVSISSIGPEAVVAYSVFFGLGRVLVFLAIWLAIMLSAYFGSQPYQFGLSVFGGIFFLLIWILCFFADIGTLRSLILDSMREVLPIAHKEANWLRRRRRLFLVTAASGALFLLCTHVIHPAPIITFESKVVYLFFLFALSVTLPNDVIAHFVQDRTNCKYFGVGVILILYSILFIGRELQCNLFPPAQACLPFQKRFPFLASAVTSGGFALLLFQTGLRNERAYRKRMEDRRRFPS